MAPAGAVESDRLPGGAARRTPGSGAVKVVLDMQDRRPSWAMPAWVPERIREALARVEEGSELRVIEAPSDGSGDGAARAHPSVLAAVEDADVYLGYGIAPEVVRAGARLRWIHSGSAGVGGSITAALVDADVIFTNSAGVHGPPMAETVVGMILHVFRGFDLAVQGMHDERWDPDAFYAEPGRIGELAGSRVGIVGLGGVGREIAWRCAALGAEVSAVRRSAEEDEVLRVRPWGREDDGWAARVRVLGGADALQRLAPESDVLVVCAPSTPETRGLIDADLLSRLPRGALLVNVSRGDLIDEAALVAALERKRLGGAALDVVAAEPLPSGHPLWSAPGVFVTPHVSAVTDRYWERETALITENLRRFAEGRPLRNVVDPRRGY